MEGGNTTDWPLHGPPIRIVYSKRRRCSIAIRVHLDHVEVRVPANTSTAEIERVIEERRDWILQTHRELQHCDASAVPWYRRRYTILGDPVTIDFVPGDRWTVVRRGDVLHITGPVASPSHPDVKAAAANWMKNQAKTLIPQRVAAWATRMDTTYQGCAVKELRSRWGSCSTRRHLNFNWRLILAPPGALDYVIIHELCHLYEWNHSKLFWQRVAVWQPDYEKWRTWLRQYGQYLYF
jgi:predicted metal-dependent hydrolase